MESELCRAAADSPAAIGARAPSPHIPDAGFGIAATASFLMLLGAIWLATRPYQGVVHDARFYMAQALHALHPTGFARDLYFRYGSQDNYTLFTRFYAPLIATFGVAGGAILGALVGQLFWLFGLWRLAAASFGERRDVFLAAAGAIALPGAYALFSYGEPFVTPRLFAEAMAMSALGSLLRNRTCRALLVLAVSAAIHPLMALPALVCAFVWLAVGRPVWWVALLGGVVIVVGLSFARIQPFTNLRVTIDPAWFDIVKVRSSYCLISGWSISDYCRAAGTTALAVLGLVLADPGRRRLLAAALAVGLGGLACTLLGGDIAHNLFIVEIQPWRSMWLLAVLANLCAAPSLSRLLRLGPIADLTVAVLSTALALQLASGLILPLQLASAPLMTIATSLALWQFQTARAAPPVLRAFCLAAIAFAGAAAILIGYRFVVLMEAWPSELWRRSNSFVLLVASLGLLALQAKKNLWQGSRTGNVLPWVAASLVLVGAIEWDQRTPWTKFVEETAPIPRSLFGCCRKMPHYIGKAGWNSYG